MDRRPVAEDPERRVMARFKDGVKERKCGCLYFEYGPPVKCPKHTAREKELEEKGLRRLVSDQAKDNGHELTRWAEYESRRGKWTCHCMKCGLVFIAYDAPPDVGDQIAGWGLGNACKGSDLVQGAAPAPKANDVEDEDGDSDDETRGPADTSDGRVVLST